MKFVRLILFLVLSPRVQEKDSGEKMVLIAIEAVLASSKPPAVDDSMRTSQVEDEALAIERHC